MERLSFYCRTNGIQRGVIEMKKFLLSVGIVSLFMACTPSPKTPEGLLRLYISDVTTKELDKDYYLERTAGTLREQVESMNEDELAKSSYLKNVSKVKVDILSKNCQGEKCAITYVVSYDSKKGDKVASSSETKKIAELLKEEGKWKISSVTNLKTFIESNEPIEPLTEEN